MFRPGKRYPASRRTHGRSGARDLTSPQRRLGELPEDAHFHLQRVLGFAFFGQTLSALPNGNLSIQRERLRRGGDRRIAGDLERMLQFVRDGGDQPIIGGPRVHLNANVTLALVAVDVRYARSNPSVGA